MIVSEEQTKHPFSSCIILTKHYLFAMDSKSEYQSQTSELFISVISTFTQISLLILLLTYPLYISFYCGQ